MPGATKMLVLLRLQQVERFLVGEARVIDDVDAMPHRLLDRFAGPGMARHALAALLGLGHGDGDLLVAHPGRVGRRIGREVVARQVELDGVDAVLEEHAHDLAHLLRAAHHDAEAELGERQVRQHLVAQAAGHGDLLARRQIARTGDQALVDGVARHHVEPRLGAGGADAGGEARLEVAPRHVGRPQHVLLERHALDAFQGRRVVPREVRVGLDHARHQRGARAVDHRGADGRDRPRAAADAQDAVALDQNVAGKGRRARAVDDPHVGEEHVRHRCLLRFLFQRRRA